jgi:hypothetical protein
VSIENGQLLIYQERPQKLTARVRNYQCFKEGDGTRKSTGVDLDIVYG